MSAIATDSSAIVEGGEAKRTSSRIHNRPCPPLAVFCGITVDRSGSMSNIHKTAAEGVFKCIKDQIDGAQENSQIGRLFLTTFDDRIKKIHNNTDFKSLDITIKDLLKWMEPRGCTKLYDAAIEDLDNIMKSVEEYKEGLPSEVRKLNPKISIVWVCCTDGFDNSSDANCSDFRKKVKEAKKAGVQCIFIAANQDAVLTGQQFGFDKGSSMTFGANNVGAAQAFRSVSKNIRHASASGLSVPFTQAQRLSSLGTTMDDDSDDDDGNFNTIITSPPRLHRSRNIGQLRQPTFS